MKEEKRAESFIGIIIGVFILSFVLLGIGNMIFYSRNVILAYQEGQKINLLKENISHILMYMDTGGVEENEIFYVYKDMGVESFKAFTGVIYNGYKYIDQFGNNIADIYNYNGEIYERILWKQKNDSSLEAKNEIIKISIKKLIKK